MDAFFSQVSDFIAARHLLPQGSPVIAGVSGGADSLALLLILDKLRGPLRLPLVVAHLNHGLRGAEADADEAFVRDWCQRLNVDFCCRKTDVGQLARAASTSLEEAGRQARHAFFNELADQQDLAGGRLAARIALAHHLDDQAETLLLHLGRGSGLDGLTGMKPSAGRLIRPLLGQPRAAIETWLQGQDIVWRQDASNLEHFALRNRLRLQVFPAWTDALGYDPAPLMGRTATSLAEDQELLQTLTSQAAKRCRSDDGLQTAVLLKLEPALQNRVLRLFWQERTGSGKDLAYTHIQLLRNWLQNALSGQRICLPGNWRARVADGLLLLDPAGASDADRPAAAADSSVIGSPIELVLPGITKIPQMKKQIAAVLIENDSDIVYNDTAEYFHLERIAGSIVRNRLPGDRIHPYGRTGGKTLKKFLNEAGIRPEDRDRQLLVARNHEVVWLPGLAAGIGFAGRRGDGLPGPLIRLELEPLKE